MSRGTVLITGASAGIGAALAHQFARNDFDLVITARRENSLQEVKDSISAENKNPDQKIEVITGDLGTLNGATTLIEALAQRQLDIDILVNNAGIAITGKFDQLDESEIDNLLTLNILNLTKLLRHYLPSMIQRGSGRILNVASVAAFQPVPSMNIYAASKAFVLSLTESLSEELKGTGVSVTALCPGLTKTDMVEDLQARNIPPIFMSSPEEVAKEGFDALMAREVIRIPGIANQAAVSWAKHQPRWLVRALGGLASKINPLGH